MSSKVCPLVTFDRVIWVTTYFLMQIILTRQVQIANLSSAANSVYVICMVIEGEVLNLHAMKVQ